MAFGDRITQEVVSAHELGSDPVLEVNTRGRFEFYQQIILG